MPPLIIRRALIMPHEMKMGVVLINLGTPDDTKLSSIRRYLREFFLDPRVIDLNGFFIRVLVYGAILPFRPFKTSIAYRKVWEPSGSPLRFHTEALVDSVQKSLGSDYKVVMAMRYGNPSIASILNSLTDCSQLIVLPLFPQYSSAATGSAMAKFMLEAAKLWNVPKISVIDKFYNDLNFINPYVELIRRYLSNDKFFCYLVIMDCQSDV
jgi:ferrochelatase